MSVHKTVRIQPNIGKPYLKYNLKLIWLRELPLDKELTEGLQ